MPAVAYHAKSKTISRGAGRSMTAASAYRSGTKIEDKRTGEIHDYTNKGGVEHAELIAPELAPMWAMDRESVWSEAEIAERNKTRGYKNVWKENATVGREFVISFPDGITHEDRVEIGRTLSKELVQQHGVAVDLAIHAPGKQGDQRNYHAHILFSDRRLDADGFGKKVREWNVANGGRELVEKFRQRSAELGAEKLKEHGLTIEAERWRYAYLKLEEQSEIAFHRGDLTYARDVVKAEPTIHLGSSASAMERRGIETYFGNQNREVYANAAKTEYERTEFSEELKQNPELIIDRVSRNNAVFSRADLAKELNKYIENPEQYHSMLTQVEGSSRLAKLEDGDARSTKYATREQIQLERRIVGTAVGMSSQSSHGIKKSTFKKVLQSYETKGTPLLLEQQRALAHVVSNRRFVSVVGDAGTGKSFTMGAAKEAWEAQGYHVVGGALAGKAAEELQAGSGIESSTLHSLQSRWELGTASLDKKSVLVIDEAGMLGAKQIDEVLGYAHQQGAKVVMLGDDKQLGAIEAGAAFRTINERIEAGQLTEVFRQRDKWQREASKEFARGSFEDAMSAYADRGFVDFNETREAARTQIVEDYLSRYQHSGSSAILSHTNAEARAMNKEIHAARAESGDLKDGALFVTSFGRREFSAGDRVIFRENNKDLDVKNGSLGTVVTSNNNRLTVSLDRGKQVGFSIAEYDKIDYGYAATVHKAQGITVDRAFVLATPGMTRDLAYVAMTRHRQNVTLYAGHDDFKDIDRLTRILSRENVKQSTLDFEHSVGYQQALKGRVNEPTHEVKTMSAEEADRIWKTEYEPLKKEYTDLNKGRLKSLGDEVQRQKSRLDKSLANKPEAPTGIRGLFKRSEYESALASWQKDHSRVENALSLARDRKQQFKPVPGETKAMQEVESKHKGFSLVAAKEDPRRAAEVERIERNHLKNTGQTRSDKLERIQSIKQDHMQAQQAAKAENKAKNRHHI